VSGKPHARLDERSRPDDAVVRSIRKLVSAGEGQQLEFKAKANHPDKIARSLCAFANSKGGTLLLGVNDDGQMTGIRYPDEDIHSINRFLRGARPIVKCRHTVIPLTEKRWLVRFDVRESNRKPVRLKVDKEQVYFRHGDQCLHAGPVMAQVMARRSSPYGEVIRFGDSEKRILNFLGDGNPRTLEDISRSASLSGREVIPMLVSMVASGILRIVPGMLQESFRMNIP